jgi:hypothetical protein
MKSLTFMFWSLKHAVVVRREDCLEDDDNFLFDQDLDLEHFVPLEHIREELVPAYWPVLL